MLLSQSWKQGGGEEGAGEEVRHGFTEKLEQIQRGCVGVTVSPQRLFCTSPPRDEFLCERKDIELRFPDPSR